MNEELSSAPPLLSWAGMLAVAHGVANLAKTWFTSTPFTAMIATNARRDAMSDDIIESRLKYGTFDDDLGELVDILGGRDPGKRPTPSPVASEPDEYETIEDVLREARNSSRKYGA